MQNYPGLNWGFAVSVLQFLLNLILTGILTTDPATRLRSSPPRWPLALVWCCPDSAPAATLRLGLASSFYLTKSKLNVEYLHIFHSCSCYLLHVTLLCWCNETRRRIGIIDRNNLQSAGMRSYWKQREQQRTQFLLILYFPSQQLTTVKIWS